MTIFVFLVLLFLLHAVWSRIIHKGLNKLSCTRAVSRPAMFVGEEAELIEVVRNDTSILIPWLLIESQISPYMRLGKQDNLHMSGNTHFCSQFTLLPYQQIHRRHRMRFLRRGSYNLGNAALSSGDIFGFSKFHKIQELNTPVLVYPALIADAQFPLPLSNQLNEITQQPQLLQDPFLFRGLRPYQPGDPVRDIHWAATARTDEVQILLHDYSARKQLLVVLNTQIHESQWHDHLSDEHAERIEYGISLAATTCVKALREGMSVGFAANMPLDDQKESVLLLPSDSSTREEELLTTFARLTVRRTQNFLSLLDHLSAYSGMYILIISAYDSESIYSSIKRLEHSGNQIMYHLLEGGSV